MQRYKLLGTAGLGYIKKDSKGEFVEFNEADKEIKKLNRLNTIYRGTIKRNQKTIERLQFVVTMWLLIFISCIVYVDIVKFL